MFARAGVADCSLASLQKARFVLLHWPMQVEEEDVSALCQKLVTDLQQLVQAAAAEQADDLQGLCALCGRDMPLTKHHLIPRCGPPEQSALWKLPE